MMLSGFFPFYHPILSYKSGNSFEIFISGQQYQIIAKGCNCNQSINCFQLPSPAPKRYLELSRLFSICFIWNVTGNFRFESVPFSHILFRPWNYANTIQHFCKYRYSNGKSVSILKTLQNTLTQGCPSVTNGETWFVSKR